MRKLMIIVLAVVAIAFTNCKKEDDTNYVASQEIKNNDEIVNVTAVEQVIDTIIIDTITTAEWTIRTDPYYTQHNEYDIIIDGVPTTVPAYSFVINNYNGGPSDAANPTYLTQSFNSPQYINAQLGDTILLKIPWVWNVQYTVDDYGTQVHCPFFYVNCHQIVTERKRVYDDGVVIVEENNVLEDYTWRKNDILTMDRPFVLSDE